MQIEKSTVSENTIKIVRSNFETREPFAAEDADLTVPVVDSRAWLSLTGILLLFLGALTWGIWGVIPTRVHGAGILFAQAGTSLSVPTIAAGQIRGLMVKPGQQVMRGQIIAILDQPELQEQFENQERTLSKLRKEQDEVRHSQDDFITKQHNALATRRQSLNDVLASTEAVAQTQRQILANYEYLLSRGVISKIDYSNAQVSLGVSVVQIANTKTSLAQLEAEEIGYVNRRFTALQEYNLKILDAEKIRDELSARIKLGTEIRSGADGYVATVDVGPNAVVALGTTIATLRFADDDLEALIFIRPEDGKLITPGMQARIAPSTVKPEEFGTIIGTVTDVGSAPDSRSSILAMLNNDVLVSEVTASGAPILVRVSLTKDSTSPSGFRWTSGSGPNLHFTNSTPAGADFVVREQAPVTLVIPVLQKWLGITP